MPSIGPRHQQRRGCGDKDRVRWRHLDEWLDYPGEVLLRQSPFMLSEGGVTSFWIYVRDGHGNLVDADINEFKIRHRLVPSSPPLPHPIAVEVVGATGKAALDLIFPKGTPLPAERTVKYRAVRTLSPADPNSGLAVKLWEGEFLDAPEANEWVGNILIAPSEVKRSVPQGTEIEVTVRISDSRLITVDAYIAASKPSTSAARFTSLSARSRTSPISLPAFRRISRRTGIRLINWRRLRPSLPTRH